MAEAAKISPDHPVYLDRFLEAAIEVDVDALCDGKDVFVGGILEHIEMAGIHSGDSACCTPPFSLSLSLQEQLRDIARRLALRLGVVGLLNIQFAIKDQVDLRNRGKSAREPHCAVCLQVHGRAP